ncbi:MAG: chemotaxis-specific protein-glutamate methyltransferase CheB [Lachnospiraceae bacterium]|nr:chemotaxis-specific protein-glutamate methyltransferase CheB [Lachnospiraceae bacterium]
MKKNILVIDDSALMRRVICDIIHSSSDFQVADICRDGLEGYEKLCAGKYDGVLLDINMPRMDGLELLKKLKEENRKATVIIVSSLSVKGADVTLRAIELGAVDFVTKPENFIEAKGESFKDALLGTLDAVCGKPKRHSSAGRTKHGHRADRTAKPTRCKKTGTPRKKLIALACSTGGPKALQSVIPYMDQKMDAPMIVVQHMPEGFTKSMANRLNELSSVTVKEAEDGELLKKGVVYVAPGGKHLKIRQAATGQHRVELGDEPPVGRLKPCANITYESLRQCAYDEVTCVVLTGMGEDGTKGIVSLARDVPVYIIAQDKESCVVYGMPRAIAETGLTDEVVPLEQVAKSILKNVGVK